VWKTGEKSTCTNHKDTYPTGRVLVVSVYKFSYVEVIKREREIVI